MTPHPSVRAVTFDFWGTLYADRGGVSAERTLRRARLVAESVARTAEGARRDPDALEERLLELLPRAARLRDEALRGLTTAERLKWALAEIGLALPADALGRLAREVADLGVALPPRPVDGALNVVAALAGTLRVGLVSDTGIMDGLALRRVMAADGLIGHFGALGFSDETGRLKPHADAFLPVLARLGVAPREALHVGDLQETDVAGALSLGMQAIWIGPGACGPPAGGAPHDGGAVRVNTFAEVPHAIRGLGGR